MMGRGCLKPVLDQIIEGEGSETSMVLRCRKGGGIMIARRDGTRAVFLGRRRASRTLRVAGHRPRFPVAAADGTIAAFDSFCGGNLAHDSDSVAVQYAPYLKG